MGGRLLSLRAQPIDAHAVTLAESKQVPARLERDLERIINSACNLTRVRIIRALAETALPRATSHVSSAARRQPSQHIRVLRDIGAIAPARTGNVVRYRLTDARARILVAFARAFDVLRER